jgi:hypothetical protein
MQHLVGALPRHVLQTVTLLQWHANQPEPVEVPGSITCPGRIPAAVESMATAVESMARPLQTHADDADTAQLNTGSHPSCPGN